MKADELFNNRETQKNLKLLKGSVIFEKGSLIKKLNYCLSGEIKLLFPPVNNKPSKKICSLRSRQFLLIPFLFEKIQLPFSVVANTDVVIHSYPFLRSFTSLFRENPSNSLLILNSVINEFNQVFNCVKRLNNLNVIIDKLYDNAMIYLGNLTDRLHFYFMNYEDEFIVEAIDKLKELFKKNEGFFPADFSIKFFEVDNSNFLNKKYSISLENLNIDVEMVNIILNFTKIDQKVKLYLIKNNSDFVYYIFKRFSKLVCNFYSKLNELFSDLDKKLNILFSSDSNLSKIIIKVLEDEKPELVPQFIRFIKSEFNKIGQFYQDYFEMKDFPFDFNIPEEEMADIGMNSNEKEEKIETLDNKNKSEKEEGKKESILAMLDDEDEDDEDDQLLEKIIKKKEDSIKEKRKLYSKMFFEIVNFSNFEQEKADDYAKALNYMAKVSDKFGDHNKTRIARKKIRMHHWELYKKTFLKFAHGKKFTRFVKNFILYGAVDERFISDDHLKILNTFIDRTSSKYLIYDSDQWLGLIYNNKEEPSINDLGQTFDQVLREEARRNSRKRDEEEKEESLDDRKVNFEIDNLFTRGSRVVTDSPLTSLPIFLSELVPGDLEKYFLTREKLTVEIDEILKIDFTLFYREALYRTESKVEIFQKEILPIFIRLPVIGSKVFLWQDYSGNKMGPARFIVPMFFKGDLRKSLIQVFGTYRWEICKSFKGPKWSDPVDGGLTGKYFDYINFYNKNPHLSPEVKQAIRENFAKFKSDREKFVNDYYNWIEYESKGIIKVNTLVRDIFLFEIPFPRPILEKLKRIPVYEKLIYRYNNLRKKEIQQLVKKYRKFEDEDGNLPPELQHAIDILKK